MIKIAAKMLLPAAGMLLCSLSVTTGASLAGSVLENTQETTVGSQATYDNSWAQTFQVTGNVSVNGGTGTQSIAPFAQTAASVSIPNSGTAVLNSSAQVCQQFCVGFEAGGVVSGSASITPAGQSNNITLNSSNSNGLPAITLNANDQAGGPGFGASVVGQNIGTESLQTQGTRKSITSNRLSVF
jgi:hypothetical protein